MSKKEYFASKNGQGSEESPMRVLSAQLIKAYGGLENIKNVDACITKLRIQVADQSKADKQKILDLGARGVMYPSKQSVYAVFGTQADRIKNEMKSIMADPNAAAIVEKASASDQPVKEEASNKSAKAAKPVIICAPANGKIISTKEVKDETFSQDIMGKGFAIIPSSGKFVAPIKGKVALIDNHAYAIEGESGVQVLVHIGIDTVTLAGKGVFKHHVKVGDKVNVGDPIIDADLNKIKKAKLSTATPVIALNETIGEREVKISKTGQAKAKDKVLTIK
ncbi:MAG: glucose PTS transporter subunit IIA [Mycoplasmoidaceae bacterium]|nr:glucose PTS transporter subunit IIA [Mycoplasmoidaceae bacterium]